MMVDQNLEDVKEDLFEKVWKIYEECSGAQRYFNGIQAEYRKLTSTWLIAYLFSLGFIVAYFDEGKVTALFGANWSPVLITIFLSFAVSAGVALIWMLDLRVYHRLLQANFLIGLKMEKEHTWLPPKHHAMMLLSGSTGVEKRIVWFYVASFLFPFFIGTLATSTFALSITSKILAVVVSLSLLVFGIAFGIVLRLRTETALEDFELFMEKLKVEVARGR